MLGLAMGVLGVGLAVGGLVGLPTGEVGVGRGLAVAAEPRLPLLRIPTFQGRRGTLWPAFRHQRCYNCHGFHVPNAIGQVHIDEGRIAFPCATCHTVPGWNAPPASFDLVSKTLGEICVFMKDWAGNDPAVLDHHFKHDALIRWAVGDAVLRNVGQEPQLRPGGRAPPGDLAIFDERIDAWIAGGMRCE
jgi:hypothetical protein